MEQTATDTSFLKRCIGALEQALDSLGGRDRDDVVYDLYRTVCVKQFELVLEQSGKLLRKRLRPWFASNRQADRLTFRDLFRHAAKHGLLPADACERWLKYRDNRNDAAHDDGEGFANVTLKLLPGFITDAAALADVMSSTARAARGAPPAKARAAGTLHLSARHRATLEALLQENLPDAEVWAYGSRVNGQSHDGSDLDLVLRGPGLAKIDAMRYADFLEAVGESTIPFLVEAHDWGRLPETFHRGIERDHVVMVANAAPGGDWQEIRLGEVIELKCGYNLPKYQRQAGSVPVVSSSGITDYHSEIRVDGPGVVTGRYGTIGKVFFVPGDYWPLNTTLYVSDFKGNDPRFISYFLRGIDFGAYSDKSAVPGVNRHDLHQVSIRFPTSVTHQRTIAHVLGILDDKIALNRRMGETLEAMVRALFKSWFVDFDPVRAKQEGRDTGLPKHLADLFPDRLVQSSVGGVPDVSRVAPLSELFEINPRRSLRKGRVAPYVAMANMPTTGHVPSAVIDRPFGSGTRFINGDTLVARITPCLENGKTAYVDFLEHGVTGWGSTEYIVMRPKAPLPNVFAYCLARTPRFRQFLIRNMSGTSGRQRAAPQALSGFLLPAPDEPVARMFEKLTGPLIARVSAAARESRRLLGLRDALLPELISGRRQAGSRRVCGGDRPMTEVRSG